MTCQAPECVGHPNHDGDHTFLTNGNSRMCMSHTSYLRLTDHQRATLAHVRQQHESNPDAHP